MKIKMHCSHVAKDWNGQERLGYVYAYLHAYKNTDARDTLGGEHMDFSMAGWVPQGTFVKGRDYAFEFAEKMLK